MGMFDWVERPPVKCKNCGEEINEFQTKSGFNRLLHVTPEQLLEDSNRVWGEVPVADYYGYCDNCNNQILFTWNEETKTWEHKWLTQEEQWKAM